METQAIATEFYKFYEALYNRVPGSSLSENRENQRSEEMRDYIRESSMPTLLESITAEIEHPITVEELSRVIAALPTGKSPGPDGLTNTYKKMCSLLIRPLCNYFNTINAANLLPPEALLAYINLLPKGWKDPQYCAQIFSAQLGY